MVSALNELGHAVSWERVQAIRAARKSGGRTSLAQCGSRVVPKIKDAFRRNSFSTAAGCYVQRVKITPAEAIDQIQSRRRRRGSRAPGRTGLTDDEVASLTAAGLDGLEVHYPRHSKAETLRFLELAGRLDLLVTGGSDDHGDINEGRQMGRVRLPWLHVERLKEAVQRRGSTRQETAKE